VVELGLDYPPEEPAVLDVDGPVEPQEVLRLLDLLGRGALAGGEAGRFAGTMKKMT